VHRLLKNHASVVVGERAYALLTSAAATQLEVPVERGLWVTEEYEHLAPIEAVVFTVPIGAEGPPAGVAR
jgi:hypothetical protein